MPADPGFDAALAAFVQRAQAIIDAHFAKRFPRLTPDKLVIDPNGRKYIRIVSTNPDLNDRSVYCFVERATGNVLKAETWKRPAKHSRGNIYSMGSADGINAYGANYLR